MAEYLFICYPKCSTCQKARRWLDQSGVKYRVRDIALENPNGEELAEWKRVSGLPLKSFFNTSGMQYRQLELKDKLPAMDEGEQLELLATSGMLVKRPLLVGEELVLVGFKQELWEKSLLK